MSGLLLNACIPGSDDGPRPDVSIASPAASTSVRALETATAAAPAPTVTPASQSYTVQPGDTLGAICVTRLPSLSVPDCIAALVQLNGLNGPDQLAAGQVLMLPPGSGRAGVGVSSPAPPLPNPTGAAPAAVVATATELPAPAPTAPPTATATPTAGVDRYVAAVDAAIILYGVSLDLLTELYSKPALNDSGWRSGISEAGGGLIEAGRKIRGVVPPACLQGAHQKFLAAAGQFDGAAGTLAAGLAQSDPARFTTAGDQLRAASATLGEAIDAANEARC